LFWVARVPRKDLQVHLGEGKASLKVTDLAVTDWKTNGNSISGGKLLGPGVPATVSYEINWSGATRKVKVRDAKNGFAGLFVETGATISWSSSQKSQFGGNPDGFAFVSDAASTTKTDFAEIGHERNGVFFPDDDDDDDDD
jgi:hypothetical protein